MFDNSAMHEAVNRLNLDHLGVEAGPYNNTFDFSALSILEFDDKIVFIRKGFDNENEGHLCLPIGTAIEEDYELVGSLNYPAIGFYTGLRELCESTGFFGSIDSFSILGLIGEHSTHVYHFKCNNLDDSSFHTPDPGETAIEFVCKNEVSKLIRGGKIRDSVTLASIALLWSIH